METGYHILVVVIAILAIRNGWKAGFSGEVPGLLGFAFGVVCANIFRQPIEMMIAEALPWLGDNWAGAFILSNLASFSIYSLIFLLFKSLTQLFKDAFSLLMEGVVNSLFGALASLLLWMMFTSIALNLIVCIDPEGALPKYASDNDANIAGVTTLMAPAILGSQDAADLAHIRQLRDARAIS